MSKTVQGKADVDAALAIALGRDKKEAGLRNLQQALVRQAYFTAPFADA